VNFYQYLVKFDTHIQQKKVLIGQRIKNSSFDLYIYNIF
jgi:hypothetical protein